MYKRGRERTRRAVEEEILEGRDMEVDRAGRRSRARAWLLLPGGAPMMRTERADGDALGNIFMESAFRKGIDASYEVLHGGSS
uniref:Uncharacterized protein n=1 Tax=Leersia perrieri TaxID=77586 RepID=A0A0D9UY19_9ORYZ